jgi:hypothetical protein
MGPLSLTRDFREFLQSLNDQGVEYLVIGGPAVRRLWPWLGWLLCFYGSWLTIVIVGDHWQTIREHWGIAVAMAFGSYVAGSTPMGGGTVGFPILVLLFDLPATGVVPETNGVSPRGGSAKPTSLRIPEFCGRGRRVRRAEPQVPRPFDRRPKLR